ncbi:glycophorin-C isoform X1 [Varanus komodoensis]|uniref:glycophorin-C isoform X1 n=1 Tax=Varanus komodoensis TaxID=61221 RepID=UPI001CF7A680|nr:glycophorin-C isoform X1 [Varanus komodoensis]
MITARTNPGADHCVLYWLATISHRAANIGSSPTAADIGIIGGVIAAVAFVLLCLLVVMLRYMYRHKGTYHTNEAKGTEFAESADAALKNDPAIQGAMDESRKEYFI